MLNRNDLFFQSFNPKKIPDLQLWLDASQSSLTRAVGMASQFTAATTEYLSVGDNASIRPGTGDFSLAGWLYMDTVTAARSIIGRGATSDPAPGYWIYVDTSARLNFQFIDNSGQTRDTANSTAFSTGAWHFWVISFDRDGVAQIYIDNVADGNVSIAAHAGTINNALTLSIGLGSTGSNPMDGRQCGVGLWSKVLSTAEIAQLYNSGVGLAYDEFDPGLKTSLISYWELNEPSGTRADLHGTNNLTDNNTVTTNPGVIQNAVTTWADLSGKGQDATQATQANKPVIRTNIINGKRVLFFDGVDDHIGGTISTSANVGLSIYAVGRIITAADVNGAEMIYCGGDALDEFRINTTPVLQTSLNSALASGSNTLSLSTNYIFSAISDNINQVALINGDPEISAASIYNIGTSKYRIGARDNSSTFTRFWNGYLGEIIVYNRPLNSAENRQILHYLNRKWGVSIR